MPPPFGLVSNFQSKKRVIQKKRKGERKKEGKKGKTAAEE
jgi:hypothetical protein